MNVNALINRCVNLSYYDLEDFAGKNYVKVYEYMTACYEAEKVNTLLIGSIFTCVASDGKMAEKEWKFISSFIGDYTYDEAFSVAGEFYNAEAQSIVKDLVGMFPDSIAEAFICLCIAVLCVDGRLDGAEADFLRELL